MDDTLTGAALGLLSAVQELVLILAVDTGLVGILKEGITTVASFVRAMTSAEASMFKGHEVAFLLGRAVRFVVTAVGEAIYAISTAYGLLLPVYDLIGNITGEINTQFRTALGVITGIRGGPTRALTEFDKEVQRVSESLEEFGKQAALLQAEFDNFQYELGDLTQFGQDLEKSLNPETDGLQRVADVAELAGKAAGDLSREITSMRIELARIEGGETNFAVNRLAQLDEIRANLISGFLQQGQSFAEATKTASRFTELVNEAHRLRLQLEGARKEQGRIAEEAANALGDRAGASSQLIELYIRQNEEQERLNRLTEYRTQNLTKEEIRDAEELADLRREINEVFLSTGVDPNAIDDQQVNELIAQREAIQEARREQAQLKEEAQELEDSFREVGNAMGDAFSDVITNAKNAKEAIAGVIELIGRMIIEQTVAAPIAQFVTSGLSAAAGNFSVGGTAQAPTPSYNGNVFENRTIIPHASGGLITRPTVFQMGNGRLGSAAERDTEAILPLTRRNGVLGVADFGGGKGGNVTVNMNVSTPNADSFRRSSKQINRQLARGVRSAGG